MGQAAERLVELVEGTSFDVQPSRVSDAAIAPEGVVRAGSFSFRLQWSRSGAAGAVAAAIGRVKAEGWRSGGNDMPLVVVPFMGEAGRRGCAEAGVAWIDLSGNASIVAPGLRVHVEGRPDQYRARGRPSSVFAPRSSRIARWLLMHPSESFTQREIARATDMSEGYTSRIVGRLESDGFVIRDAVGAVKPKDSGLLLDAWREVYEFSKHRIVRGHIAARTGDVLLRQVADAAEQASVPYAATGLAAAWLLDRFAAFRIATVYLADEPNPGLLDAITFREEERGANVWLVMPNDEGVLQGAVARDGIQCVHPVQAYLDLGAHPERADEAAQRLRSRRLSWAADA